MRDLPLVLRHPDEASPFQPIAAWLDGCRKFTDDAKRYYLLGAKTEESLASSAEDLEEKFEAIYKELKTMGGGKRGTVADGEKDSDTTAQGLVCATVGTLWDSVRSIKEVHSTAKSALTSLGRDFLAELLESVSTERKKLDTIPRPPTDSLLKARKQVLDAQASLEKLNRALATAVEARDRCQKMEGSESRRRGLNRGDPSALFSRGRHAAHSLQRYCAERRSARVAALKCCILQRDFELGLVGVFERFRDFFIQGAVSTLETAFQMALQAFQVTLKEGAEAARDPISRRVTADFFSIGGADSGTNSVDASAAASPQSLSLSARAVEGTAAESVVPKFSLEGEGEAKAEIGEKERVSSSSLSSGKGKGEGDAREKGERVASISASADGKKRASIEESSEIGKGGKGKGRERDDSSRVLLTKDSSASSSSSISLPLATSAHTTQSQPHSGAGRSSPLKLLHETLCSIASQIETMKFRLTALEKSRDETARVRKALALHATEHCHRTQLRPDLASSAFGLAITPSVSIVTEGQTEFHVALTARSNGWGELVGALGAAVQATREAKEILEDRLACVRKEWVACAQKAEAAGSERQETHRRLKQNVKCPMPSITAPPSLSNLTHQSILFLFPPPEKQTGGAVASAQSPSPPSLPPVVAALDVVRQASTASRRTLSSLLNDHTSVLGRGTAEESNADIALVQAALNSDTSLGEAVAKSVKVCSMGQKLLRDVSEQCREKELDALNQLAVCVKEALHKNCKALSEAAPKIANTSTRVRVQPPHVTYKRWESQFGPFALPLPSLSGPLAKRTAATPGPHITPSASAFGSPASSYFGARSSALGYPPFTAPSNAGTGWRATPRNMNGNGGTMGVSRSPFSAPPPPVVHGDEVLPVSPRSVHLSGSGEAGRGTPVLAETPEREKEKKEEAGDGGVTPRVPKADDPGMYEAVADELSAVLDGGGKEVEVESSGKDGTTRLEERDNGTETPVQAGRKEEEDQQEAKRSGGEVEKVSSALHSAPPPPAVEKEKENDAKESEQIQSGVQQERQQPIVASPLPTLLPRVPESPIDPLRLETNGSGNLMVTGGGLNRGEEYTYIRSPANLPPAATAASPSQRSIPTGGLCRSGGLPSSSSSLLAWLAFPGSKEEAGAMKSLIHWRHGPGVSEGGAIGMVIHDQMGGHESPSGLGMGFLSGEDREGPVESLEDFLGSPLGGDGEGDGGDGNGVPSPCPSGREWPVSSKIPHDLVEMEGRFVESESVRAELERTKFVSRVKENFTAVLISSFPNGERDEEMPPSAGPHRWISAQGGDGERVEGVNSERGLECGEQVELKVGDAIEVTVPFPPRLVGRKVKKGSLGEREREGVEGERISSSSFVIPSGALEFPVNSLWESIYEFLEDSGGGTGEGGGVSEEELERKKRETEGKPTILYPWDVHPAGSRELKLALTPARKLREMREKEERERESQEIRSVYSGASGPSRRGGSSEGRRGRRKEKGKIRLRERFSKLADKISFPPRSASGLPSSSSFLGVPGQTQSQSQGRSSDQGAQAGSGPSAPSSPVPPDLVSESGASSAITGQEDEDAFEVLSWEEIDNSSLQKDSDVLRWIPGGVRGTAGSGVFESKPLDQIQKTFNRKWPHISERVQKNYACAYQGLILLQGDLYVTANWLAFYSPWQADWDLGLLTGKRDGTTVEVPLADIERFEKENVAAIFPTAIKAILKKKPGGEPRKPLVFASFVQRNLALAELERLRAYSLCLYPPGADEDGSWGGSGSFDGSLTGARGAEGRGGSVDGAGERGEWDRGYGLSRGRDMRARRSSSSVGGSDTSPTNRRERERGSSPKGGQSVREQRERQRQRHREAVEFAKKADKPADYPPQDQMPSRPPPGTLAGKRGRDTAAAAPGGRTQGHRGKGKGKGKQGGLGKVATEPAMKVPPAQSLSLSPPLKFKSQSGTALAESVAVSEGEGGEGRARGGRRASAGPSVGSVDSEGPGLLLEEFASGEEEVIEETDEEEEEEEELEELPGAEIEWPPEPYKSRRAGLIFRAHLEDVLEILLMDLSETSFQKERVCAAGGKWEPKFDLGRWQPRPKIFKVNGQRGGERDGGVGKGKEGRTFPLPRRRQNFLSKIRQTAATRIYGIPEFVPTHEEFVLVQTSATFAFVEVETTVEKVPYCENFKNRFRFVFSSPSPGALHTQMDFEWAFRLVSHFFIHKAVAKSAEDEWASLVVPIFETTATQVLKRQILEDAAVGAPSAAASVAGGSLEGGGLGREGGDTTGRDREGSGEFGLDGRPVSAGGGGDERGGGDHEGEERGGGTRETTGSWVETLITLLPMIFGRFFVNACDSLCGRRLPGGYEGSSPSAGTGRRRSSRGQMRDGSSSASSSTGRRGLLVALVLTAVVWQHFEIRKLNRRVAALETRLKQDDNS
uniref:GRAM domain-containing protein n=1 Tax=Chromera velia CCMP2878 TaxID=1169474 RepID=A0A0K6S845_9ALVE|eukprot:Cvel_22918.t1-p1 / transcript=Cvel_22918.t1 / gene=Cvel_22918 / organism=Chromera_velia_CCMP2878 / gene_product=hypothetical protein / transcript_product=hypothetical protein / location=Cvel_scaffold2304:1174-16769(+) / protein_length=2410 / sequence_SO=supercontig / SO=protein_coding / is_pseudo=false